MKQNNKSERFEIKAEFEIREHMLKEICLVCKKNFKLKEKIVLCPIQESAGNYFINSIALPIHTKCYYVEKDEK